MHFVTKERIFQKLTSMCRKCALFEKYLILGLCDPINLIVTIVSFV
jgi:hypothetical protein